jgi:hypothetical protein
MEIPEFKKYGLINSNHKERPFDQYASSKSGSKLWQLMDVPSIDQEVIGGVWRISKSQLAAMPFLRRSATASNWILMRGVRKRGGVRPRELFSLCTIGERALALVAISFNNYGHSIPSHSSALALARRLREFFVPCAKKKRCAQGLHILGNGAPCAPVRVCLLASSRPLILFTYAFSPEVGKPHE